MENWFETMDDGLWLLPDDTGEEEARFIKRALGLRKGQTVLDAPCGAGRIAYHLARSGCVVTGVDLRRTFISRARSRFRKVGLEGTFIVGDLRELDLGGPFHGICSWGGSFGYFADRENFQLVQRYVSALRPGGRLLIDQANRENLLRNFAAELRPRERLTVRNHWDTKAQRIISRRILDGKEDPGNMSSLRLYTRGQMRSLLEKAGLAVEAFYGSSAGDSYGRRSRRMVAVGRKR